MVIGILHFFHLRLFSEAFAWYNYTKSMIKQEEKFYRELRCHSCRKLLALEYVFRGRLAIKCPKCGENNVIEYKTPINRIERIERQFSINNEPIMDKTTRRGVTE